MRISPLRTFRVGLNMVPVLGSLAWAAELAPPGFRPDSTGIHALLHARVFVKPDAVFSNATIVLRDGLIISVGPDVVPPGDARVWDFTGLTIYPGFLDAYLALGATNSPLLHSLSAQRDNSEASSDLTAGVPSGTGSPQFFGVAGQGSDPGSPGPGHGLPDVTPERRVVDILSLDSKEMEALRELGFAAGQIVPWQGIFRGQGAVVLLGDAGPNRSVLKADSSQVVSMTPSRREGVYPASLMGVLAVFRQAFMDARHAQEAREWHRNPSAKGTRVPVNLALEALAPSLSGQPVFIEPGSALMAARVDQLSTELGLSQRILVACGQEWRRPEVIRAGSTWVVPVAFPALPKLPDEASWEGVTLDQLRAWDWAAENPALLRKQGAQMALTTHGLPERKEFRSQLKAALDRGLRETDALAALTTIPAQLCGVSDRVGTLEPGKLANLTVVEGNYFDPEARVREVWIEGRQFDFGPAPAKAKKPEANADGDAAAQKKKSAKQEVARQRVARSPQTGRGTLAHPPAVWVRRATLWTSGPQGILTNADLVTVGDRILAVGPASSSPPSGLPEGALVIDAAGGHVTPGLIDAHSHSMIMGGVNEQTLPSTAMCRIADVVNSESARIYEQLAGGLTVANLLHGSANPIGGQNCVIKLREGASPNELVFKEAPQGIKFALGENVKQSNWGEKYTTRFPQSRMGVPVFYQNRFEAAIQYTRARKRGPSNFGAPVRRDLELEALAEIIDGTRLIHCHSYRQDEILVFLRTMENFGIRVATLQHVLEGYKVADEIAKHGAGGSAFSDWWGYKYEVIDAIPYAGSLMHQRGVVVSFNSDSDDHARRLHLEAAKAVKYGGTPEAEALKFVTLNPAKQLRIENRVGSLEPGKDADFALWSGSPLDSTSVCMQTWIEGRKYFDRGAAAQRGNELAMERTALIEKAKKMSKDGDDTSNASQKAREAFFQAAWENARHLGVKQCEDCVLPRRQ